MTCRHIDRKSKKVTNTISFVSYKNISVGRTVIYSSIVVDVGPQKEYTIRVRLTVGGNRIEYPGKVTTKMADLTTFNIHINSVISKRGARYAGWNIGIYYLETSMGRS